jgi:phosphomannomutase
MKETNAIIGGEGNGGIIYSELHYGRDALVGIALFLTHLAKSGKSISALKNTYPVYHIGKHKITLPEEADIELILGELAERYAQQPHTTIDGLKIEFGKQWVHMRKSNTEPVIRIYAEAATLAEADTLAEKMISEINAYIDNKQFI